MFIPRTLTETEHGRGRGPWVRALIVGAVLFAALWAITSVSIGGGQVDFEVGDVAQNDISAPRTISFVSTSQTDEARREAADEVAPVYVPIAPRSDIRDEQLDDYDRLSGDITDILQQRDDGELTAEEVPAELEQVVPQLTGAQQTQLQTMPLTMWDDVVAAGRDALEAAMSGPVRDESLSEVRHQAAP